ncbi:MAG: hypothetical protein ACT4TC_18920 [Myxococcaceae bacterium]
MGLRTKRRVEAVMLRLSWVLMVACLAACGGGKSNSQGLTRSDRELLDIRSRLDRTSKKGLENADEYVDRIVNSVDRRDRIAERIERRSNDDVGKANKTIGQLRENATERGEETYNEWATRYVSGTVNSVSPESVKISDQFGTTVELKPDPFTTLQELKPGSEVRAGYEIRDGQNIATDVEVVEEQ